MTLLLWLLVIGFIVGLILMIGSAVANKNSGIVFGTILAVSCAACFLLKAPLPHKNEESTQAFVPVMSYADIYQAYEENALTAEDIYKGNRYELSGEIVEFETGGVLLDFGKITIYLKIPTGNKNIYFYAEFPRGQREKLKNVRVGDTIRFIGRCRNKIMWVDCELVEG